MVLKKQHVCCFQVASKLSFTWNPLFSCRLLNVLTSECRLIKSFVSLGSSRLPSFHWWYQLYSNLLYSALLYSTLLFFSAILYFTIFSSSLFYSALLCSTTLYYAMLNTLFSSILLFYSTLLYSTLLFSLVISSSFLSSDWHVADTDWFRDLSQRHGSCVSSSQPVLFLVFVLAVSSLFRNKTFILVVTSSHTPRIKITSLSMSSFVWF